MGLMTAGVLAGAAPLLLLEVCGSALRPGHQRSPLPAGQGSQWPDLHLGEVEGRQVALPRFPVHSLTAGQRIEPERLRFSEEPRKKAKHGWKEMLGVMRERGNEGGKKKGERQRGERWSQRGLFWRDRQVEWQTLINTSFWLHFMWVQTCFDCYCISPTNIAGDICSSKIMDEISTRAEISPGISFSISLP